MSLHQRPFEPSEQSFADRTPYFSDVFNRAHGHDDNPHVGRQVAERVAALVNQRGSAEGIEAEHTAAGHLVVTCWGTDEDSGDSIVTFQAVQP